MRAHKLENQAIEIVVQAPETDHPPSSPGVQYSMAKRYADKAFAQAGFAPRQGRDEIGVVELHGCFVANEACRVCWAGPMQAPGLFSIDKRGEYGLVHNIGIGGVVVVSLLRRPEFFKPGGTDGRTRYAATSIHYVY